MGLGIGFDGKVINIKSLGVIARSKNLITQMYVQYVRSSLPQHQAVCLHDCCNFEVHAYRVSSASCSAAVTLTHPGWQYVMSDKTQVTSQVGGCHLLALLGQGQPPTR